MPVAVVASVRVALVLVVEGVAGEEEASAGGGRREPGRGRSGSAAGPAWGAELEMAAGSNVAGCRGEDGDEDGEDVHL
jgi:hypothetical protein